MTSKVWNDTISQAAELGSDAEPSILERATLLNQGERTERLLWPARRADLSLAESECSAGPGGYYALGKPPRIPRARVNLWPLAGFCAIVFGIPSAWWLVATIARAMP